MLALPQCWNVKSVLSAGTDQVIQQMSVRKQTSRREDEVCHTTMLEREIRSKCGYRPDHPVGVCA